MCGEYGVMNFLKILDIAIELGNITAEALEDKKISITDAALLFKILDELTGLAGFSAETLKKELSELGIEDRAMIADHFKNKFNIPQENIEAKIESGIMLALKLIELCFEIKNFVVAIKA